MESVNLMYKALIFNISVKSCIYIGNGMRLSLWLYACIPFKGDECCNSVNFNSINQVRVITVLTEEVALLQTLILILMTKGMYNFQ